MITTKENAIIEVGKEQPNYKEIDKYLLKDKDVVIAYMQAHSSNALLSLNSKFSINLDFMGLINDEDFIIQVINNLDVGYNQDDLVYLLKLSAARIVQSKYDIHNNMTKQDLEEPVSTILKKYRAAVLEQQEKLSHKKQVVDGVFDFIHSTRILDDLKSNDEKIVDKLIQVFDIMSRHLDLSDEERNHIDHCTSDISKLLRQNVERRENFEKRLDDSFSKNGADRYSRSEIGFK